MTENLYKAIEEGNVEAVARLIGHRNSFIYVKDYKGNCLLNLAAQFARDEKIIELLVNAGLDVNTRNKLDCTPLHNVVRNTNSLEAASFLLTRGADVNAKDFQGKTPLHYIVTVPSKFRFFRILSKFNADFNATDNHNLTPLIHAIVSKQLHLIETVLFYGADVNLIGDSGLYRSWNRKYSPIELVLKNLRDRTDIIECLLQNGVNVNQLNEDGLSVLTREIVHKPPCEKIIRLLLKYGGNIEARFPDGSNILQPEGCWRPVVKHIAKLRVLEIPVDKGLIDTIWAHHKFNVLVMRCGEELFEAKCTTLSNTSVTFLNLLVDHERKLMEYAGNEDLIEDFMQTNWKKKFRVFAEELQSRVSEAQRIRKLWDDAAAILSDQLPIFKPSPLIIREILDSLTVINLEILTSFNS